MQGSMLAHKIFYQRELFTIYGEKMSLHQTFFTCMNPWLKCSATWHISGGREYAGDRMVSSFCRAATMEMGGAHGPPGQLYQEGASPRGSLDELLQGRNKKK